VTIQSYTKVAARTSACTEPDCGYRSHFPLAAGQEARLICGWCGTVYLSGDGGHRAARTLQLGFGARHEKAVAR